MAEKSFPMSNRALELIAHRFKLLSEPTRLRLLQLLMDGEKSVNELVSEINTTQANVSKQLKILQSNGVVSCRPAGLQRYYSVVDNTVFKICQEVCDNKN
jgi:DNA-binding transcriptional ArsR family regulator